VLTPSGEPIDVVKQADPPIMAAQPLAFLQEAHTGRSWFYGTRGDAPAIQSLERFVSPPQPKATAGVTTFVVFMPGARMSDALVSRLKRRANRRARTPPAWARDAADAARRRRGGAGARGAGPGAGQTGTGEGGGGNATMPADDKTGAGSH